MSPPPRLDPRYRLLDAWRGFACLAVVLHHAGFVVIPREVRSPTGGLSLQAWVMSLYEWADVGVPLFFVISGYCIAASMDSHRAKRTSSWRFLARRVWRIYPPYWAAVACFAAVVASLRWAGWRPIIHGSHSLHLDSPGELTWVQWLGNLTLTETWRHAAFGGDCYRNLTRISWTLCFEEQFYLVGFAVLLLFPRRLFGALAVVSGLIFAVALAAFDAGWLYKLDGTFFPLWYEFAVGLVVYWRLVVAESKLARRSVDHGLVALGALGLSNNMATMVVVAAFGLILIALRRFDALLAAQRILAPFFASGRRCYSIYLIHLPVCTVGTEALYQLGCTGVWARLLVAGPLVSLVGVGAGWLFYSAVESRFHNPPSPRPVAGPAGALTEGPAVGLVRPLPWIDPVGAV